MAAKSKLTVINKEELYYYFFEENNDLYLLDSLPTSEREGIQNMENSGATSFYRIRKKDLQKIALQVERKIVEIKN